MPQIKNQAELQQVIEKLAEEALEKIADRVLTEFQRDYIAKYVYIDSPKMYQRTFDFLRAWDWTPVKKEIMTLSKTMWYNPGKVSPDIDKYQHGSIYSRPEIVISSLMDILNKQGRSSSLWLSNGVNRKEAYFDKFIEDFFDGGRLEKIITQEFSKRGFKKV